MLRERFYESLRSAIKAKDSRRSSTLRLIVAALKDRDIAARSSEKSSGVEEEDILNMMQTMIRQRKESIEMYRRGNRDDLAAVEEDEIKVIEEFLPTQLSDSQIATLTRDVINELEAQSIKDMGHVMGVLKTRYAGCMDFGKASQIVKQILS